MNDKPKRVIAFAVFFLTATWLACVLGGIGVCGLAGGLNDMIFGNPGNVRLITGAPVGGLLFVATGTVLIVGGFGMFGWLLWWLWKYSRPAAWVLGVLFSGAYLTAVFFVTRFCVGPNKAHARQDVFGISFGTIGLGGLLLAFLVGAIYGGIHHWLRKAKQ